MDCCVQGVVKALFVIGFVCLRIPLRCLCLVLPAPSSPPRKLSLHRQPGNLKDLPGPPPLPIELAGLTIGFSACANLCFFCMGALACLQAAQARQKQDVLGKIKFAGISAGAIVAALGALSVDVQKKWLSSAISAMDEDLRKVVGIPMCGKARWCPTVLIPLFAGMLRGEGKEAFQKANGACNIGVTTFSPGITRTTISNFSSNEDLINVVAASCSGPVIYPTPYATTDPYGVSMDGAVSFNFIECDVRVSPFASNNAKIGVDVDYDNSNALMTGLVHHDDLLLLFEDGYMKCLEWLTSVAQTGHKMQ